MPTFAGFPPETLALPKRIGGSLMRVSRNTLGFNSTFDLGATVASVRPAAP